MIRSISAITISASAAKSTTRQGDLLDGDGLNTKEVEGLPGLRGDRLEVPVAGRVTQPLPVREVAAHPLRLSPEARSEPPGELDLGHPAALARPDDLLADVKDGLSHTARSYTGKLPVSSMTLAQFTYGGESSRHGVPRA